MTVKLCVVFIYYNLYTLHVHVLALFAIDYMTNARIQHYYDIQ